jgi:hypothetical protein
MQVTLQYLSERLRMLPLPMLQLLVPYLGLQQHEQHTVVFNRGDEAGTFYIVLSGAPPPANLLAPSESCSQVCLRPRMHALQATSLEQLAPPHSWGAC